MALACAPFDPPPPLCRAVVVLPMFLEVTRLFGGFFLAPALQKQWMVVLDYIRCAAGGWWVPSLGWRPGSRHWGML